MITYRTDDLLQQQDLDAILHQANCFNTMRAGIALAIATKYPEAREVDAKTMRGDKNKLGTYTIAKPKNGPHIVNLYGQYSFAHERRRHTNYDALRAALQKFVNDYSGQLYRIGIPYKIGCGLAHGDWHTVLGILRDIFKDDPRFELVIVKLQ